MKHEQLAWEIKPYVEPSLRKPHNAAYTTRAIRQPVLPIYEISKAKSIYDKTFFASRYLAHQVPTHRKYISEDDLSEGLLATNWKKGISLTLNAFE